MIKKPFIYPIYLALEAYDQVRLRMKNNVKDEISRKTIVLVTIGFVVAYALISYIVIRSI